MNICRWVAAAVFFLQLPNPVFWLVVHPQIGYWRGRLRAAYATALVSSWGAVTVFLIVLRHAIFARTQPGDLRIGFGLLLIAADIWLFERARQDLGTLRLVGKAELSGGGEVVDTGIYSYVRNPRYTGMIAAVLGACVLAATPLMWGICGIWFVLVLIVIGFEERELRARLGATYVEYCRRVPRFIPYRTLVRAK
jgi:protein-S-isoprenylcysteine O-methyltransferase Ste14